MPTTPNRAQRRGLLYRTTVGWWWSPAKWLGRVVLWFVFWPVGLWRSHVHGQRRDARRR